MRVFAALVACAVACGGEEAGDDCVAGDTAGVEVSGAAALGFDDGGFVALESGADLELELGTQGGWMVRPVVQFDAASLGASDGACVWVESVAAVDGQAEPVSMIQVPEVRYQSGVGQSAPLLVLLSFDLEAVEGREANLEIRVEGPAAGTTTTIDVSLVNVQ